MDYTKRDGFEKRYQRRCAENAPGWTNDAGYQETLKSLEQALLLEFFPKSGRSLELGCGAGNLSLFLAARGFDVQGVDLSPTAIAWANRKAQESNLRADFRVGNAVTLEGYSDEFFDLVLDGGCLQSVIGDDRRILMTNVRRVLRPGGLFRVNTICGNNEIMEPSVQGDGWCYDPQSRCQLKDRVPYYYVGLPGNILDEICEAGFEVLKSEVREGEDRTGKPFIRGQLVVDARRPVSLRI